MNGTVGFLLTPSPLPSLFQIYLAVVAAAAAAAAAAVVGKQ